MRTIQFEVGFVVIKVPGLPVAHVVAGFTCGAQASLVYVLFFMARPAIRFRVLESRGSVTFFALHQEMLAQQRKAGKTVIELGLGPGLLIVTRLTFFAFLSFVLVVFFMACNTLGLQLVFVYITLVAAAAFHFFMLEEQRVFGRLCMVE